jgi:cytochrome c oxidase subunit 4
MNRSNPWHPPRILLLSWLALLGLLTLTVSIAYLPIGTFNTPVALTIALVKGLVVAAIFMELRGDRTLVLAAAGAGFYWLAIFLWLAFADFLTRPNFPPGGISIF